MRHSPQEEETCHRSEPADVEFRTLCRALSPLVQDLSPQAAVTIRADHYYHAHKLSNSLASRYRETQNFSDLEAAIRYAQDAANTVPVDHPYRAGYLNNFTVLLHNRYNCTGNISDLETAIKYNQDIINDSPTKDIITIPTLHNLSGYLFSRFNHTGNIADLQAAIKHMQNAIQATQDDHFLRINLLTRLSQLLVSRYNQTRDLNDLEDGIKHAQDAIDMIPVDDSQRVYFLENLSVLLSRRFRCTGKISDLEAAIEHVKDIIAATTSDHPARVDFFKCLATYLSLRYDRYGNIGDLQAAIQYIQNVISATKSDNPNRAALLQNLSIMLESRYHRTGNVDDEEAAIRYARDAIGAISTDDSNRANYLSTLSNCLSSRHHRTGNIDDLQAAIGYTRDAIGATLPDDLKYAGLFHNLSSSLSDLFHCTGNVEDLQAAVRNAKNALDSMAINDPNHAYYLENASNCLSSLYECTGNLDDLEAAISHAHDAVHATLVGHPSQAARMHSLSATLCLRYNRTGNMDDLEAAITYAQDSVNATLTKDLELIGHLRNLSLCLLWRYNRTSNIDDLEAAIRHTQDAVAATPAEHNYLILSLNLLSGLLAFRYEHIRNLEDLEGAIRYAQRIVTAYPIGHRRRAEFVHNLSNRVYLRYKSIGDIADLDAALRYAQEAVHHIPSDHTKRCDCLFNFSCLLASRYLHTKKLKNLEAAISYSMKAARVSNAVPLRRIVATRHGIRLCSSQLRWHNASEFAEIGLQLLPLVCSRSLTRDDQQFAISQIAGFAADACSILLHLNEPARALQSLEFGRGLIIGYLIDSRSDPEQLEIDYPHLAHEYNRLKSILSRPIDSIESTGMKHLAELKQKAPRELEKCLTTIRNQPGYERFLLEPAVDELIAQATDGPLVIVNITDFGSHAVIVLDRDVYSLGLSAMSTTIHFDLNQRVQRFRDVGQRDPDSPRDLQSENDALGPGVQTKGSSYNTESLAWLWEHCVEPILISIEARVPEPTVLPRIWWIGTGAASSLPFHAAGIHHHQTQSTMERSISSYTPTIKTLGYSRSCIARKEPHDGQTSVAIVAMPTTPHEQPLPGVQQEIDAIYQADSSAYKIQVQMHADSEAVLQAMKETDIVHFACHGACDPVNPSESHLLLQNNRSSPPVIDRLTVQQISEQVIGQAYIAFLSACSTAQVTADKFSDESIHLASAFQVAGFGHVIASLWSLDDAICAIIARSFYRYLAQSPSRLLSNRLVAEALHNAVLEVRKTERPGIWASFVHYGA